MKPDLADLKPGDSVVVGSGERLPVSIRKVAKLTAKQIVLDRDDRYKQDNGRQIGRRLGVYILRKATTDDFAREEEKQRQLEESRQKAEEIQEHRNVLARLFPETFRPIVSIGLKNDFELTFFNLSETQVRKFGELVKGFK
ncbi:MAG: hypothetical protein WBC04_23350 [Candidatus Acidiferrales bacterium]